MTITPNNDYPVCIKWKMQTVPFRIRSYRQFSCIDLTQLLSAIFQRVFVEPIHQAADRVTSLIEHFCVDCLAFNHFRIMVESHIFHWYLINPWILTIIAYFIRESTIFSDSDLQYIDTTSTFFASSVFPLRYSDKAFHFGSSTTLPLILTVFWSNHQCHPYRIAIHGQPA